MSTAPPPGPSCVPTPMSTFGDQQELTHLIRILREHRRGEGEAWGCGIIPEDSRGIRGILWVGPRPGQHQGEGGSTGPRARGTLGRPLLVHGSQLGTSILLPACVVNRATHSASLLLFKVPVAHKPNGCT